MDMEEYFYFVNFFPPSYLAEKPGWGPTFTIFRDSAKKFPTEEEAQKYIDENLPGLGCKVVHGF